MVRLTEPTAEPAANAEAAAPVAPPAVHAFASVLFGVQHPHGEAGDGGDASQHAVLTGSLEEASDTHFYEQGAAGAIILGPTAGGGHPSQKSEGAVTKKDGQAADAPEASVARDGTSPALDVSPELVPSKAQAQTPASQKPSQNASQVQGASVKAAKFPANTAGPSSSHSQGGANESTATAGAPTGLAFTGAASPGGQTSAESTSASQARGPAGRAASDASSREGAENPRRFVSRSSRGGAEPEGSADRPVAPGKPLLQEPSPKAGKEKAPAQAAHVPEAKQTTGKRAAPGNQAALSGEASPGEQSAARAPGQEAGGRHRQGGDRRHGSHHSGQQGGRHGNEGGGRAEQGRTKAAPGAVKTAAPDSSGSKKASSKLSPAPPAAGDVSLEGDFTVEEKGEAWKAALSEAGKMASSGKSSRAEAPAAARRALPTAWLKAATQGPLRTASLTGGWKAVEVALAEGDGTVTIKARRDQDGVNVSVGFSDPRLRAQATANARQLQDALQAQYDTDVDLSFAGGDAGGADQQMQDGSTPEHSSLRAPFQEAPAEETAAPHSGRRAGAQREWVG